MKKILQFIAGFGLVILFSVPFWAQQRSESLPYAASNKEWKKLQRWNTNVDSNAWGFDTLWARAANTDCVAVADSSLLYEIFPYNTVYLHTNKDSIIVTMKWGIKKDGFNFFITGDICTTKTTRDTFWTHTTSKLVTNYYYKVKSWKGITRDTCAVVGEIIRDRH